MIDAIGSIAELCSTALKLWMDQKASPEAIYKDKRKTEEKCNAIIDRLRKATTPNEISACLTEFNNLLRQF
jgi:hypothetical protein